MALTREELLLLMIFTSPVTRDGGPAVIGSVKMQKLIFLALQELELIRQLCHNPYEFIAYDFGPYSPRIDRDLRQLEGMGWVSNGSSGGGAKCIEELTFEELTKHVRRTQAVAADLYILRGPAVRQVAVCLGRLKREGLDVESILESFRKHHAKYGSMTADSLLKYVYAQYPGMSVNTKRRDLLPVLPVPGPEEEGVDDDP